MASSLSDRHSNSLLLSLLDSLADYDGQLSEVAVDLLNALRFRSDTVPPLYADVFKLPALSTCAELVDRVESLTPDQLAVASYAFQIFRSYEQLLKVNTANVAPEQRAAYESQLERIRQTVARTRSTLDEAIDDHPDTGYQSDPS